MPPRISFPRTVNGFRIFSIHGKWFAASTGEGVIYHGPSYKATERWARTARRYGPQAKRPHLYMLADSTSGKPIRISSNRHYLETYIIPDCDVLIAVPFPSKKDPNT